jgi:hypothetical protein
VRDWITSAVSVVSFRGGNAVRKAPVWSPC